jgi:hypothetical protein
MSGPLGFAYNFTASENKITKGYVDESLEAGKNGSFIRKIDPEVLKEYVEKHPDHR